ncbi:MAG: response regulator [Pseudomonadales bacterium]|nr:response regulator [Pseudomonadales bacterium]
MAHVDYHKKKFMIIEDHAEFRSSLKAMVRMFGAHMVDTAHNGEEGIAKIINNQYDIILSDYELGKGKDGQQILEETRRSGLLKSTSIFILVTAASTVEMVMGALEYEPDGYITKPITHENLKTRLDKIVQEKNLFSEVDRAIDQKKYKNAINACNKIAKENPKYQVKALRIKSKLLLNLEHYDDAGKLFQKLVDARAFPWAVLGLGKIAFYKGDFDKALQIFQQLADEDQRNVEAYDWLSKVYISQNLTEEAQKALQHAVERSPKSIIRQMDLGNISKTNEDWSVAEVAFRKSVNLGKNSCYKTPDNYTSLVQVLQDKISTGGGRKTKDASTEALRTLDNLEKEFPDNTETLLFSKVLRAETSSSLGKEKEAEHILASISEDIAALNNKMPEQMAHSLANVYDAAGKKEEASKLREKYNKASANEVLNNDGVRLFKSGQIKEALSVFGDAAKAPDASNSVLINALQASIKLMENEGTDDSLIENCDRYMKKLDGLDSSDKNYMRFKKLSSAYENVTNK